MKINIDGKEIEAAAGSSVLEAALNAGIYIPHLCNHPDLEAKGGCRLCSVEIEGIEEPLPACTTKAKEGMVINITGEKADKVRKMSMELILASHPADCTGCPKYGKCELQSMYQYMGVSPERFRRQSKPVANDSSNPLIHHLFTRCVRCGRCIRACQDLRGVKVLDYVKGKEGVHAGIPEGKSLQDAGCRFCGACIEVCPTGSIIDAIGLMKEELSYAENVVPCRSACPAHIDIPQYIRYIKDGKFEEAVAVIHEKVPFPKTLGSICSHICESQCKRNYLGEPVSVCKLKLSASFHDNGAWKAKRSKKEPTGKKAAIIGSGPAGLTAAYYLAKQGHEVTVFEKQEKAGGQCRYGIPAYRLSEEVLDQEIADILEMGITLKTSACIKYPAELLEEGFHTVLTAVGTHQGLRLPMEGNNLEGVLVNTDFLRKARSHEPQGILGQVMVLGGGNVAYDCARTALRLGASQVHIACLENLSQMTATQEEIEEGKEEGIVLHAGYSFLRITGEDKVTGVELQKVDKFFFDENHKAVIELVENANEVISADTVIFAVGQRPESTEEMGLSLCHGSYICVDSDMQTSVRGIYAAGDVVTGTQSVIVAIAAGRECASKMDRFLGGDGNIEEELQGREKKPVYLGQAQGFAEKKRCVPEIRKPEDRIMDFEWIETPFNQETAKCEASRCMQCDLRLDLTKPKLWNEY